MTDTPLTTEEIEATIAFILSFSDLSPTVVSRINSLKAAALNGVEPKQEVAGASEYVPSWGRNTKTAGKLSFGRLASAKKEAFPDPTPQEAEPVGARKSCTCPVHGDKLFPCPVHDVPSPEMQKAIDKTNSAIKEAFDAPAKGEDEMLLEDRIRDSQQRFSDAPLDWIDEADSLLNEAADTIKSLREGAEAADALMQKAHADHCACEQERAALKAQVEKLREALKPFSVVHEWMETVEREGYTQQRLGDVAIIAHKGFFSTSCNLSRDNFSEARTALSKTEKRGYDLSGEG